MGGVFAVRRANGPSVGHLHNGGGAGVDHGLHGDGHAPQQAGAMAGAAIVGHLRRLVHVAPDAVTHILPDDAVALTLGIRLNGGGDVGQAIALLGVPDALKEALLGGTDQPQRLVGHLPAGVGAGAVAMEAADERAHVHADDVALLQHPLAGDAVDDLIVDGDAHAGRIAVVVQERRGRSLLGDELIDCLVNLLGCYAGFYHIPCHSTGSRGNLSRPAHQFDLVRGFQRDHSVTPNSRRIACVVPATVGWSSTVFRIPRAS